RLTETSDTAYSAYEECSGGALSVQGCTDHRFSGHFVSFISTSQRRSPCPGTRGTNVAHCVADAHGWKGRLLLRKTRQRKHLLSETLASDEVCWLRNDKLASGCPRADSAAFSTRHGASSPVALLHFWAMRRLTEVGSNSSRVGSELARELSGLRYPGGPRIGAIHLVAHEARARSDRSEDSTDE